MSGVFKVKLTLGKGFPQEPPKAFFLTKIFHPNVAPNGEICVNTLKKDWKSDLGIKHILLVSAARPSARSNYQPLPCRPSNASWSCPTLSQPWMRKLASCSSSTTRTTRSGPRWWRKFTLKWVFQSGRVKTKLYLQPQKISKESSGEGPLAKKHASDKNKQLTAEKKKILKDKKRTLKRLWKQFAPLVLFF